MLKTCSKCKNTKPHTEFHLHKSSTDGIRKWCKFCCNESNKCWYKKNPLAHKQTTLKRIYGVTSKMFTELLLAQNNACKICNVELSPVKNGDIQIAHVDHCHTTGKIRGLLCRKCNTGLGMFSDNVANLQNAIRYLNENGS